MATIQFDDEFMRNSGIDRLDDSTRTDLVRVMYEELELRVGTRLCDGLSDQQIAEFEAIIERDLEALGTWLQTHDPYFSETAEFKRLDAASAGKFDPLELVAEYAATKWLQINRPDYKEVVSAAVDELKEELVFRADEILRLETNKQPGAKS